MSDDEKMWIGDALEVMRTGSDVLRLGRELADALDPDPAADQTATARLQRIVAALCTRQKHDELAIDALRERCKRLELERGQLAARVSVLEKAAERPHGPIPPAAVEP